MTEQSAKVSAPRSPTPPPNPIQPKQPVHSTPVRPKLTAHTAFAIEAPVMEKAQARLVNETQGHYVGPMPPHLFVDQFMPWNDKTPKRFRNLEPSAERITTLQSMAGLPESQRYAKIISALSGWPHDCTGKKAYIKCPLELKDSHSYRDVACGSLGVDITGYHSTRPRIPRKTRQIMDFANAEMWWEDKGKAGSDAFVDGQVEYDGAEYAAFFSDTLSDIEGDEEEDAQEEEQEDLDVANDGNEARETCVVDDLAFLGESDTTLDADPRPDADYPFENQTAQGRKTRGQLASYGGATMICQFRNHLLSIFTCGRYARFIRWDRSAAIVSARFDFVDHPDILFDFFKRFSQLTDGQRGIDTTARPATKKQAERTRQVMQSYAPEYWMGRAVTRYRKEVDIASESFFQVRFKFDDQTYITPAPLCDVAGFSPFGRCSRARMVFDITSPVRSPRNGLRFAKDYYREDSKHTYPESIIYKMLKEKAVEYVATMTAGGDTGVETVGHTMLGNDWVTKGSKSIRIRHLYQHVIILETIGRSLVTFRTARQLVTCLADAMEGHTQALQRCSILHRDISVGNIMMTLTPKLRQGILIDWDHCVVLDLIGLQPRITRVLRTGTWQFLSAHLAQNPLAEHTAIDDRESALHVLLWCSLRHLQHDLSIVALRGTLQDIFDQCWQVDDGPEYGTDAKEAAILRGGFPRNTALVRQPVQHLIRTLCKAFATRYDPRPVVVEATQRPGQTAAAIKRQAMLAQLEAEEWDEAHSQLESAEWFYTTMRQFAEQLPEFGGETGEELVRDWVDNGKRVSQANIRKRGREDDSTDEEDARFFKQSKMLDGLSVSSLGGGLNAQAESKPEL